MSDLDRLTAAYGEANAKAWLRVIRERESSQDDSAYTIINGGTHFSAPPWRHPYAGQSAPPGRAAGAYQYIPHTWERVAAALGFGDDFRPINQDLGALYLTAGRGALDDVLRGDVAAACAKCRQEWTSLPGAAEANAGWTVDKAIACFKQWGGTVAGEQPAAPATPPSSGGSMPALVALQLFGPLLANLIPQIASLFKPGSEVAQRNVGLAETIVNTINTAAAAPNLQAAVEKMQADPEVVKTVQKAVVTQPEIMETLQVVEIGGGIGAARAAAATAQVADKPFWYNPVVWVTVAMLPIMYLICFQVLFTLAGPYLVSNGVPNIPLQPNPWYAVVGFDSNTRTGLINLIVGFVFGGVCGIWFGTTVAKRSDTTTATDSSATTTTTTMK